MKRAFLFTTWLVWSLWLTGCQTIVTLMPTPAPLQTGLADPFAENGDPNKSVQPLIDVFYATNRLAVQTPQGLEYLTLFDRKIRLGMAVLRFGENDLPPEQLYQLSTTASRRRAIPIRMVQKKQLAEIEDGSLSTPLSSEARNFFDFLNRELESRWIKDLIVYVHGANNTVYRATAQAAQFQHFTGRNAIILSFCWPSAASLLRYAVDVNNAARTVPVFAHFLRLLAKYTPSRRINVIAYSAGAQVVSPALALLANGTDGNDRGSLRQKLRLGEIYYAAPDLDLQRFLKDLNSYIDLPAHVTLAINPDDSVLAFAAAHHGVSRAGRPDPAELSREETLWVVEASHTMGFDILWVNPEVIPDLERGEHGFWYASPWVSSDILIQMLLDKQPAERGLVKVEEKGEPRIWTFPADYPERLGEVIGAGK